MPAELDGIPFVAPQGRLNAGVVRAERRRDAIAFVVRVTFGLVAMLSAFAAIAVAGGGQ